MGLANLTQQQGRCFFLLAAGGQFYGLVLGGDIGTARIADLLQHGFFTAIADCFFQLLQVAGDGGSGFVNAGQFFLRLFTGFNQQDVADGARHHVDTVNHIVGHQCFGEAFGGERFHLMGNGADTCRADYGDNDQANDGK